jgi:hypothetical protein
MASLGEETHQSVLYGVGVLEFIDEDVLDVSYARWMLRQQCTSAKKEIVEVLLISFEYYYADQKFHGAEVFFVNSEVSTTVG